MNEADKLLLEIMTDQIWTGDVRLPLPMRIKVWDYLEKHDIRIPTPDYLR